MHTDIHTHIRVFFISKSQYKIKDAFRELPITEVCYSVQEARHHRLYIAIAYCAASYLETHVVAVLIASLLVGDYLLRWKIDNCSVSLGLNNVNDDSQKFIIYHCDFFTLRDYFFLRLLNIQISVSQNLDA